MYLVDVDALKFYLIFFVFFHFKKLISKCAVQKFFVKLSSRLKLFVRTCKLLFGWTITRPYIFVNKWFKFQVLLTILLTISNLFIVCHLNLNQFRCSGLLIIEAIWHRGSPKFLICLLLSDFLVAHLLCWHNFTKMSINFEDNKTNEIKWKHTLKSNRNPKQ